VGGLAQHPTERRAAMSLSGRLRQLVGSDSAGRPRDGRGGRVVAVIECVLNQNARDAGAASTPALNTGVLHLCAAHAVGVVQIPCPEIAVLGCARNRRPGQSIRAALDTPDGRARCREISAAIGERLDAYRADGCRLLAVLGGNGQSPGCAVHAGDGGLLATSGILMRELQRELRARGIDVAFRGLRDADPSLLAEDLAWLHRLFAGGIGDR
jgi:predicted secreted protein